MVSGTFFWERERGRYEITHVPTLIRSRDRQIGLGVVVLDRYERICFEKGQVSLSGKPLAEFVSPGHPLLNATTDLILERHRQLLRQGAILVDPNDPGETPRALFYLEHEILDGRTDRQGNRLVASKQLQFVELTPSGTIRSAGYAPYLDYRPRMTRRSPSGKPCPTAGHGLSWKPRSSPTRFNT